MNPALETANLNRPAAVWAGLALVVVAIAPAVSVLKPAPPPTEEARTVILPPTLVIEEPV